MKPWAVTIDRREAGSMRGSVSSEHVSKTGAVCGYDVKNRRLGQREIQFCSQGLLAYGSDEKHTSE